MRLFLTVCGLLTLLACWFGPLPHLARSAFFAHMLMHMGVVAVAAPLLALAVAGATFDPVRKAPALFSPIPTSVLELIVVWAWHAPALHHAARHSTVGLVAEQGMFLACGLLVWLSAFGGGSLHTDGGSLPVESPRPYKRSPRSGSRAAAGVIGLLLTSMHMTLLGALLIFAPRPLYDHAQEFLYADGSSPHVPEPGVYKDPQLTPLADQQIGGAVMILVGGLAYLAGGLWLTAELLYGPGDSLRRESPSLYKNSPSAYQNTLPGSDIEAKERTS